MISSEYLVTQPTEEDIIFRVDVVHAHPKDIIFDRLQILYDVAEQQGYQVFSVTCGREEIVVLAKNQAEIDACLGQIQELHAFIADHPDDLSGRCRYLVEDAYEQHIVDGAIKASMSTNSEAMRKKIGQAIYRVEGFHVLGFKNIGNLKMYMDLTARDTIFDEPHSVPRPGMQSKIFAGFVVVVDNDVEPTIPKVLQELYQSVWSEEENFAQLLRKTRR